jgi:flagellar operon protein
VIERVQLTGIASEQLVVKTPTAQPSGAPSFADVLDGIRISAHAQKRLENHPFDANRLKSAVERADAKGSSESLILLDDLAFVVSVKNKTVITAVDQDRAKESVFTNIDSVVIG